ncbi:TPA: lysozyme [Escherichia coli]|nr:lysozyme [Escherichia coli]
MSDRAYILPKSWWIKDGGRDCRIRSNNCYGQVSRRDQESALACWGIDR